MLNLSRVIKPWKEADALSAHINLYGFWTETTFLTKSGDLGMVLSVAGVDYESLDNDEQQYAVKRLESALKSFGEGFHVYQYLFKTNRPEIPFATYDDELIDAAIDQRRQFFESKRDRLYQIEIFYVIVLEGARSKTGILPALARIPRDPQGGIRELKAQFTSDNMKVLLRTQIDADLIKLEQRVQNFTRQVADLMPIEVQGQQAQFSFFRRLLNFDDWRIAGKPQSTQYPYAAAIQAGQPTALTAPRAAGEPRASGDQIPATEYKRPSEANIDNAIGQPYVIYEGLTLDTVLMNRLDGDAVGPVKVLVSNPVYSHDHQHVLIPEGTIVLGEARKIGAAGFGQQRRISVAFHRMLMPDGYSVDLDQFHGLDQIGEEGLKDQVNNHYMQIFGTSIALGVIAGASQISQGGSNLTSSGSQSFTNGAASSVSQSATTILDRFIQIPPTITIREGHRVKVYFTQDMLLPAYENHRIAQSF